MRYIADKEFGVLHQVAKVQRGVSKADVLNKIQVRKNTENSEQKITSPEKIDCSELDTLESPNNSEKKVVDLHTQSLHNERELKQHNNEKYNEKRNQNAGMGKPSRPTKKAAEPDEENEDYTLPVLDFNPNATLQDVINLIQVTPYLTYADALTKREIVGLAMDKLKLEELDGVLVRKTEVERNLFSIADRLKKALLAIPVRCADEILTANNKVEAVNIMTEEINQVLSTFANFEKI
jgi:vacuolar-type H+-ATPase subunit I/STV1